MDSGLKQRSCTDSCHAMWSPIPSAPPSQGELWGDDLDNVFWSPLDDFNTSPSPTLLPSTAPHASTFTPISTPLPDFNTSPSPTQSVLPSTAPHASTFTPISTPPPDFNTSPSPTQSVLPSTAPHASTCTAKIILLEKRYDVTPAHQIP